MPESLGPSGPLRGWPGGLAVGRSIGDRCARPLPSSFWVLPPPSMRALDTDAPPPPLASARLRSPPLDSIGEQRLRRLGLCRAERHDRGAAARGRRPPRTPLALAFQPTHAFACFGDSLNRLDPSYYSQRDPHRTLRPDPPGRICHLRTAAYAAGALGPSDSPQKTDSLHTHTHASSLAPRLRNGAGLPCLSQWCAPLPAAGARLRRHLGRFESKGGAARSKWPSWRGHSRPPRARQVASEGVGPPSALVRSDPAPPIPPRGRGLGARP